MDASQHVIGAILAIVGNTWPPSVLTTSRDELVNRNTKVSEVKGTSNTLLYYSCSPALPHPTRIVFKAKLRAEP